MLSRYKILGKLGAGGMGLVYRADDLTLKRPVALKILTHALHQDEQARARFLREARAAASLNHPNVCAVHDFGEVEHGEEEAFGRGERVSVGTPFISMELVEGETLAQRIAKTPLPVKDAVEICLQIAEGLEAAHERGIVHRDLKPANVKITPDGKVKILDFGLAKPVHSQQVAADETASQTVTNQLTRPGVVVGTVAYMSPEQAQGSAVDKRTDIWAFGCILYECLTGKQAFRGNTVTDTLAKILVAEPDWSRLPAQAPPFLKAVLRQCLQKDARIRFHDIADIRIQLAESASRPSAEIPASRRLSLPRLAAGAAAVLLIGVACGFVLLKLSHPVAPASVVRTTIKVAPGRWLDGERSVFNLQRPTRKAIAISGDGMLVVYSAIEGNPGPQEKPQLFLRRMDQLEARPIAGTEGGISPFFSPDNRWVGFWSDGKLKKILVEGGVATTLCDTPGLFGASWGPDGSIVFAGRGVSGLSRVAGDGGDPTTLTSPDSKRDESVHRLPSWLPAGEGVLFTVMEHFWDRQPSTALLRMDTREWQVVLEDAADARYVPTGHLLFLRRGTLMAVRFDLKKLSVIGQPVALVEGVLQAFDWDSVYCTAAGQFDVSATGSLLYAEGGIAPELRNALVWVDQNGAEQPVTPLRVTYLAPRLSPDGRRIAYFTQEGVWVYDLERGTNSLLTDRSAKWPIWSPDGTRVVFAWREHGAMNLFSLTLDGGSSMERITEGERGLSPGSWSPDGKSIAIIEGLPFGINILDVRSGKTTPFVDSRYLARSPEFSPDGRWIAYAARETDRSEVYVQSFAGQRMKQQVSDQGGTEPLWARDGKKLFYRWNDQMWAVDVRHEGGLALGRPRLLFKTNALGDDVTRQYDVSLDSQRFLMVKRGERTPLPISEMVLVENWFEELKRLCPTSRN